MKKVFVYLIALISLSTASSAAKDPLRLTVMTYNLRFGELATLEELANHIKSFNPDFVALQEVDIFTTRERATHQNGKDFIATLAKETGMFGLYGKSINYKGGYYGVGILSRYPYIEVNKKLLPNSIPATEQRVLLEGLFDIGIDTVRFASTHLEVSTQELRLKQVRFINNYFKGIKSQYPVLLAGDFNSSIDSQVITYLSASWQQVSGTDFSSPADNPKRKIDYIFAQPLGNWNIIWTQTVHSSLSDHLPVISLLEYNRK